MLLAPVRAVWNTPSSPCTSFPVVVLRTDSAAVQRLACSRRMASAPRAGKEVIETDKAPAALGPYSQATSIDNLLYVSGQIPLVPGTSNFAAEDIEGQTDQVLKNLGAILEKAGSSFDQVLKTTVLLSDMADFQKMNGIYGKYFTSSPPARACFAVKALPLNAKVEIEAVAIRSKL